MTLIVNLFAVALTGFIVWWFWLARPRTQQVKGRGPNEIIVEKETRRSP